MAEAGRYLLTVRVQYLFLVTLHYTYKEDHQRVQIEHTEFYRYTTAKHKEEEKYTSKIEQTASTGKSEMNEGLMFNSVFYKDIGDFKILRKAKIC
jgi:hypothetical protein